MKKKAAKKPTAKAKELKEPTKPEPHKPDLDEARRRLADALTDLHELSDDGGPRLSHYASEHVAKAYVALFGVIPMNVSVKVVQTYGVKED